MLKRPPALLNLTCGVCSAPAPDQLHFGGKAAFIRSLSTPLPYQLTPVIPAKHPSGKLLSARQQKVYKDAEQG